MGFESLPYSAFRIGKTQLYSQATTVSLELIVTKLKKFYVLRLFLCIIVHVRQFLVHVVSTQLPKRRSETSSLSIYVWRHMPFDKHPLLLFPHSLTFPQTPSTRSLLHSLILTDFWSIPSLSNLQGSTLTLVFSSDGYSFCVHNRAMPDSDE